MKDNDLFWAFLNEPLNEKDEVWRTRALTAKSYKNIDHDLKDTDTNEELATYGDALLKFALCEMLLDDNDPNGLSESKKNYESDRVLVKEIGSHYDLIKRLRFDVANSRIPQNYDYEDDSHKYIATAIEALLGAHYKIYGDFSAVRTIVKEWKSIVDGNKG